MDIFAKSVEISQEILKNYGVNLSIQKGDETVIVATIDVDTETVTIPDSQEAMLILDELGSIEQSVNLYLALKMLQNDDYDLCDELIGCLEREGLPMCSDEDSLYKSILVKQLFVIFHEAGHYMISTNEEWKNYCINAFNEYIEEMNETRLDENDKSFMTNFSQDFDNEVKDYLEHELFRLDIRESSKNYMGRMHVPEETYADVTALMFLNDYIENLNFVGLRESLLGASFFLTNLSISEKVIGIDENWELEILLKCKKEMLLTLWMRMYYLGLINTMVLSEEYGVLPDESFVKDTKKYLLFQKKLSEKSKYLESWCAGNTCIERDQNRYDELNGRIKKYTRSLKQLYQC